MAFAQEVTIKLSAQRQSNAMTFMGHLDESWAGGCCKDCHAKASGLMARSPIRIMPSIHLKLTRTRHSTSDWNAARWRRAVGERESLRMPTPASRHLTLPRFHVH